MNYALVVQSCRRELKLALKQAYIREELIIFLIRVYKDLQCHNAVPLYERIKDFMMIYYPEIAIKFSGERKLFSHIKSKHTFSRGVLRPLYLKEESVGLDLEKKDIVLLTTLLSYMNAQAKISLNKRASALHLIEHYLRDLLQEFCPRFSDAVGDPLLAAKLIERAGSIRSLAIASSTKMQLVGAERAFFRFRREKTNCPKYGLLYYHKTVQTATNKGKAARQLANLLSRTLKEDYFRGLQRNLR